MTQRFQETARHHLGLTRRDLLRLGAAGFAGAALEPLNALALSSRPPEFSFVVINDLHYRDARCGPWFERVVASIRKLHPRPAFVMLAGDLSESGTPEQLGAIREIFWTLPVPVRVVVGNHDCTEGGDFRAFRDIYGPRFDYRFDHEDWQFLAFDSTYGPHVFRTRISDETLGWLERTLPSLSREKPVVVLTHFPLGRNWLRPVNAHAVIERLAGYNFQAAFGGHWHGLTDRNERGVHLSTNRCCSWWRDNHDGSPKKGYVVCEAEGIRHNAETGAAYQSRVTHQFVEVV
jgi:Calcineurin-like phosphoesterase